MRNQYETQNDNAKENIISEMKQISEIKGGHFLEKKYLIWLIVKQQNVDL